MSNPVVRFIGDFRLEQAPDEAVYHAKRCLLDLIGVAAAGSTTSLSRIIGDHAAENFAAGNRGAALLFDGRRVSPPGAALANGMTIDAFDAHDGHPETKGHAGCGVLPGLLAFADDRMPGDAFLADLIVGYEIAIRAGIALHGTVADYHTSGAWVAIAAAAVAGRRMGLTPARLREALGIAEYHGPRSQMMRCIAHPTMLKDGSGWGAMAGVSAALLARDGFTGAPAITVEDDRTASLWDHLGSRWMIAEQYLKPFPVCRWAQPAIEATRLLLESAAFGHRDVDRLIVRTFREGARLTTVDPANTEQAQYSLPFPLAAYLVTGRLGPTEISGQTLNDPEILNLARVVELVDRLEYSAKFPAERWADVTVRLKDGRVLTSGPARAHGDAGDPLTDREVGEKFVALTTQAGLGPIAKSIQAEIAGMETSPSMKRFLSLLRHRPRRQKGVAA